MGSPREKSCSLYVCIYLELKVSDIQTQQRQLHTKLSLSRLLTLVLPCFFHFISKWNSKVEKNIQFYQLFRYQKEHDMFVSVCDNELAWENWCAPGGNRSKQDKSPHYCERVFRCKRLECQNADGWAWQCRSDILGWFGGDGWLLRSSRLLWLVGGSVVRLVWLVSRQAS